MRSSMGRPFQHRGHVRLCIRRNLGDNWLQHPNPIPAIVFGLVTVLAPSFIMQPAFGLAFAASKTPNPTQAKLRSLMNHTAFGVGLHLFALLVNWMIRVY